mmetsp:Transcript_18162/g.24275  ORF Transcript_18162/g.24275 Transcript_18162/m.24275 type:complete len:97 (+) Transcript_18162:34-324(+)
MIRIVSMSKSEKRGGYWSSFGQLVQSLPLSELFDAFRSLLCCLLVISYHSSPQMLGDKTGSQGHICFLVDILNEKAIACDRLVEVIFAVNGSEVDL